MSSTKVRRPLPQPPDPRRMVLKGADRDAFVAALIEPPVPTEKLVEAFRRYRSEVVGPTPGLSGVADDGGE